MKALSKVNIHIHNCIAQNALDLIVVIQSRIESFNV